MASDERVIAAACAALRRIMLGDKSGGEWAALEALTDEELGEVADAEEAFATVVHELIGPDLSSCPYFQCSQHGGPKGVCASGCREEPSCITDQPEGGWPSERRRVERPGIPSVPPIGR